MGHNVFSNGYGRAMMAPRNFTNDDRDESRLCEEVAACQTIAKQCAFILGPARSGTTILAQIVNASDRAFITTEANYFEAGVHADFRGWYNAKHKSFRNQVSKISYAPQFGHPGEHEWWKWLSRAADRFDVVGDKMAFTDAQMCSASAAEMMPFFESRFFDSRFIFIFRDPIQTVLSSAWLWNKDPLPLVRSWALFVEMWADFIRIFPSTMTVLHSDLNDEKIEEVGAFLGLDLRESSRLLDAREQRKHNAADINRGVFATEIGQTLESIFGDIKESLTMPRALRQADQKRGLPPFHAHRNEGDVGEIAVVPTPVGRAWNSADRLLKDLLGQDFE